MKTAAFLIITFIGLSLIAHATLDDGLVLHYTFDDDPCSGVVVDQSGNGNNGTIHGNPLKVPGKVAGAYEFDGTNDYIHAVASASLDVGDQLTCAVWYNAYAYSVERAIMEWCAPLAGYCNDFGAHLCANVHGGAWTGTGANLNIDGGCIPNSAHIISIADKPLNEWHHLVVTYSSDGPGAAVLYFDGVPVRTNIFGAFLPGTTQDFYVSCRPSVDTLRWDGMLDDVRVYNRAITAEEVATLYSWRPDCGPYITQIGFSNSEGGDQDVTTFYADETLYIRMKDVLLDSKDASNTARASIKAAGRGNALTWIDLTPSANGAFLGSVPLNAYSEGFVRVRVYGYQDGRPRLFKAHWIKVMLP